LNKEYYELIPKYNSDGRICGYSSSGDGEKVRIYPDEFDRFNEYAGRRHKIVDGVIVFDENLEVVEPEKTADELARKFEQYRLEKALNAIEQTYSVEERLVLEAQRSQTIAAAVIDEVQLNQRRI